jgi:hypothetical protein
MHHVHFLILVTKICYVAMVFVLLQHGAHIL